MKKLIFVFLLLLIFSLGCTRKGASLSNISIRTPVQGMSGTLPGDRIACYGVSVRGPNIPESGPSTCSPNLGVVSGFVKSGQTLQVQVPKGDQRIFDVYLFLENVGQNVPCPQMGNHFAANQLGKIYFMGSTSNVTLTQDQQVVTVETTYPGDDQTIIAQFSYPGSCTAGIITHNAAGFNVTSASQQASGGTITLTARAGTPLPRTVLTGGTIMLEVQ
jgi:hypothetical protein